MSSLLYLKLQPFLFSCQPFVDEVKGTTTVLVDLIAPHKLLLTLLIQIDYPKGWFLKNIKGRVAINVGEVLIRRCEVDGVLMTLQPNLKVKDLLIPPIPHDEAPYGVKSFGRC